jgi:16S rRNA (uracil1498-N3)-methyltransferase
MRLHRFIIPGLQLNNTFTIREKNIAQQMRNVLRLRVGDECILSDGATHEAQVLITAITQTEVECTLTNTWINASESRISVTLFCAILKHEHFEFVVEKCTEIGIHEIVPLITERTVKTNIRQDRLEKIIKEAAEQSGRGILPRILAPMTLEEAKQYAQKNQIHFFFDTQAKESIRGDLNYSKASIFIGPEGGWSDAERTQLHSMPHMYAASLGPLTYRAETAAIIASHLIINNSQVTSEQK